MTTELTAFVLARIAADEATARAATAEGVVEPGSELYAYVETAFPEHGRAADLADRFNPARVLAECEAKRLILDQHPGGDDCGVWHGDCATLLALAQPYADHPDFDDVWRLDAPERNEP